MQIKVSKETQEKRLSVCRSCVSSRKNVFGLTCGIFLRGNVIPNTCGCKLSWKTALKGQECPQKKW